MRVIYKYELSITDKQTIDLPDGSHILKFGEQDGQIVMWVDQDDFNEIVTIEFNIVGTGQELSTDGMDIWHGTIQMSNGLVWHIYEA